MLTAVTRWWQKLFQLCHLHLVRASRSSTMQILECKLKQASAKGSTLIDDVGRSHPANSVTPPCTSPGEDASAADSPCVHKIVPAGSRRGAGANMGQAVCSRGYKSASNDVPDGFTMFRSAEMQVASAADMRAKSGPSADRLLQDGNHTGPDHSSIVLSLLEPMKADNAHCAERVGPHNCSMHELQTLSQTDRAADIVTPSPALAHEYASVLSGPEWADSQSPNPVRSSEGATAERASALGQPAPSPSGSGKAWAVPEVLGVSSILLPLHLDHDQEQVVVEVPAEVRSVSALLPSAHSELGNPSGSSAYHKAAVGNAASRPHVKLSHVLNEPAILPCPDETPKKCDNPVSDTTRLIASLLLNQPIFSVPGIVQSNSSIGFGGLTLSGDAGMCQASDFHLQQKAGHTWPPAGMPALHGHSLADHDVKHLSPSPAVDQGNGDCDPCVAGDDACRGLHCHADRRGTGVVIGVVSRHAAKDALNCKDDAAQDVSRAECFHFSGGSSSCEQSAAAAEAGADASDGITCCDVSVAGDGAANRGNSGGQSDGGSGSGSGEEQAMHVGAAKGAEASGGVRVCGEGLIDAVGSAEDRVSENGGASMCSGSSGHAASALEDSVHHAGFSLDKVPHRKVGTDSTFAFKQDGFSHCVYVAGTQELPWHHPEGSSNYVTASATADSDGEASAARKRGLKNHLTNTFLTLQDGNALSVGSRAGKGEGTVAEIADQQGIAAPVLVVSMESTARRTADGAAEAEDLLPDTAVCHEAQPPVPNAVTVIPASLAEVSLAGNVAGPQSGNTAAISPLIGTVAEAFLAGTIAETPQAGKCAERALDAKTTLDTVKPHDAMPEITEERLTSPTKGTLVVSPGSQGEEVSRFGAAQERRHRGESTVEIMGGPEAIAEQQQAVKSTVADNFGAAIKQSLPMGFIAAATTSVAGAEQETTLDLTASDKTGIRDAAEEEAALNLAAVGTSGEEESTEQEPALEVAMANKNGSQEAAEWDQALECGVEEAREPMATAEQKLAVESAVAALVKDLRSNSFQAPKTLNVSEGIDPEPFGLCQAPEVPGDIDIGLELRLLSMHASYGLIDNAQQSPGAAQSQLCHGKNS
jgi:hypothetical protein